MLSAVSRLMYQIQVVASLNFVKYSGAALTLGDDAETKMERNLIRACWECNAGH